MLRSAFRLSALAFAITATAASAQQATYTYSSAHRESEQAIPQNVVTSNVSDARQKSKLSASRSGTALVAADFDSDGYPDLVTGYSTSAGGLLLLQRGAKAAHAPGPDEWAAKAAGKLVSPYKEKAEFIDVPVSPDFLLAGDIAGHGSLDLAAAAKGDSNVYVLTGHGDGSFSTPIALPLTGTISSLAIWRGPKGTSYLVAGVCGTSGCGLQFINNEGKTEAFVATPAAPTYIETGRIDDGQADDLAILSNARPMVLDGDTALTTSPTIEKLPTTGAAALALGRYVADRRSFLQLALLGKDATLHVFTRTGVDDTILTGSRAHKGAFTPKEMAEQMKPRVKMTGTAWQEVENVPNVGSGGASLMLRAHLLGSGLDDLAVISGTQYTTVAHRLSQAGGRTVTTPAVVSDSTSSPVQAAAPARVASDARHGMVLLSSGPRPLVVAQPSTYKIYTLTTNADGNDALGTANRCLSGSGLQCTLRDAVNLTNVDEPYNVQHGTVDIINVPAGTYTLSVNNPTKGTTTASTYDPLGSVNYHLEMDGPVVMNGAGIGATIINANHVDQALTIDGGAYYATYSGGSPPLYYSFVMDAFVSGMTIQNATNTNVFTQNTNCNTNEYCNVFGGAIDWFSEGTTSSNFVLTNVNIINSTDESASSGGFYGGGGIQANVDTGASSTVSGPLDIENCSFSGNTDRNGPGGGAIFADTHIPLTVNASTFTSNILTIGGGGAISIQPYDGYSLLKITNSTFNNNSAPSPGGALYTDASATITGTTFSNNSGQLFGGAIYIAPQYNTSTPASNIIGNTFTTNSLTGTNSNTPHTQDGAAICVDGSPATASLLNLNYNRFYNNKVTVSGAATGLALGCYNSGSTGNYTNVNANNNWWGCNGLATGTGCDTAHVGNASASEATFTLANYTALVLNLNGAAFNYGTTITATASLGQNNAATPTVYSAANDSAYLATPITTFTLQNTTTPTYNPSATAFSASAATGTSYAAATATATTNNAGNGTATLTVDGATVTKTYTVAGAPDLIFGAVTAQTVKAGSTGNTYPLMVYNTGGSPTTSNVTLTDTLPSGFTATAISGTNWSCAALPALSCTYVLPIPASGSAPPVIITYTASSTPGSYQDTAAVNGGGEISTGNDSLSIGTSVEGPGTIAEAFSPATVAAGTNATVTFTLGNPSPNPVALTGVAFTDSLPAGLVVSTPNAASTTCTSGTVTATAGSNSIALSGASINPNATCTVTVNVVASAVGTYTNTTAAVTSTNGSTGGTASATLTVNDTTTTVVTLGASTGTVGGSTTLTAKITDTTNTGATPTGTVSFSNTVNGTTTSLGTYPLTGSTASTTYNESYGGTNVITATFTPSSSTYGASADATGKTITVAKASPAQTVELVDQTVQRNVSSVYTIIFTYPGKVPPSGAITVTLNGTTLAVTPTCVFKTGTAPHSNCTFTYTTALVAGQYTFAYSQAADNNYNALSGSSILTVTN